MLDGFDFLWDLKLFGVYWILKREGIKGLSLIFIIDVFGIYYLKQNQQNKMREGNMTPSTFQKFGKCFKPLLEFF